MSRWLKMSRLRVKDESALVGLGPLGGADTLHSWYGMGPRSGDNQCSPWQGSDSLTPTPPAIVMDSFAEKSLSSHVPIFKDLVAIWGTKFVSSYHV